jgi:transposase InsO family protein
MKYQFIAEHEREYSVKRMCRVFGVQRSGYYAWKERPVSSREQANAELLVKVRQAFYHSRCTYGSLRISHYWQRQGYHFSRDRIARLMRNARMVPVRVAKWHPRTTQQRPGARTVPNLLNQDFQAAQPNEKWVGDVTYIDTAEGWLYLATLLDLYSRRVVGWAMGDQNDARLVEKAWQMAVANRRPLPQLMHHSDRGSQYTSASYLKLLELAGCKLSMSRTGNCYDNAVMESFFATLKGECALSSFATRAEARSSIFEYIEGWYNRQRLHSSLGFLSPVEFEQSSGH